MGYLKIVIYYAIGYFLNYEKKFFLIKALASDLFILCGLWKGLKDLDELYMSRTDI